LARHLLRVGPLDDRHAALVGQPDVVSRPPVERGKHLLLGAQLDDHRVLRLDLGGGPETELAKDTRKLLPGLRFNSQPGEPAFPTEDYTTQPERFFAAELIREKLLRHTSDELPYTTAVSVDRFEEDHEKNLIRIWATIVVERESQKPIVIGKRGEMVKRIGTEARIDLESVLGARVFLDLHIAVHEQWREDERFLGELDWPLTDL